MSNVPEDLRYTKSHEWLRLEDDGTITVGITDHAQEQMGDLVYVELPDIGRIMEAREELAVVESVKAASDVYSPLAGEITEVNEALTDAPELVNGAPYGGGWLFKLTPNDVGDLDGMMDADEYTEIASEDE